MATISTPLDQRVREHIGAHGPMPYANVIDLALYDPEHGFYAVYGKAGRRGDFITSPEVGPLFGHVVSRAIDAEWDSLGQPAKFTVVDFGAGPGTLARAILAARPRSLDALTYIAVERSEAQREKHPDTVVSVSELSAEHIGEGLTGVVIANELLDNLAFTPVEWRDDKPLFSHVELDNDGALAEVFLPDGARDSSGLAVGRSRFDQREAATWVDWVQNTVLARGRLIVIDYARERSEDVAVRTYSDHGRAGEPLRGLGSKDITIDVDLEVLQSRIGPASSVLTQKQWLESFGITELIEEGKALWEREAATGSLAAIRGRSRVREADALLESEGLGGFSVVEWAIETTHRQIIDKNDHL